MPRVIVVGAGLAGLAAAQELRNKGMEVVVVEARDRVGGRVWTSHFKEGTSTDLGAGFIHGVTRNPIAEFAKLLKQELQPRQSCTLFDEDGTKVISRVDKRVEHLFNDVLAKACERRRHYDTPASPRDDTKVGDDQEEQEEVDSTGTTDTHLKQSRIQRAPVDVTKTHIATTAWVHTEGPIAGHRDRSDSMSSEMTPSGHSSPDSSSGGGHVVMVVAALSEQTGDENISGSSSAASCAVNKDGRGCSQARAAATTASLLSPGSTVDSTTTTPVRNIDQGRQILTPTPTPTLNEEKHDDDIRHPRPAKTNSNTATPPNSSSAPLPDTETRATRVAIAEKAEKETAETVRYDESLEDAIQAEIPEPLEGVELRTFNWHMANLEYSVCADLKDVSNRDWDQDDVYGFGGAHCVVKGGMGHICRNLARGLDIRFNCPVKRISYLSDKVSVEIGTGQRFDADACLVTLPLGVLKAGSVTFCPPLPEPKTKAIARLGFGILNKVVLLFPRVFWEASDFIGYTHNQRGTFPMFVDVSEAAGRPVLIALVSGSPAIDIERYTEAGACKLAMDALYKIFRIRTLRPLQCIVTRWHSDPYALGSYSFVQVNGSADDYDAMAAPVASRAGAKRGASFRLFFAGEATNRYYPATVHGAFLSGIREAKRILTSLRVQTEVKRQSLTSSDDGTVVATTTTPVMQMDRSMSNKGRMGVKTAHRTNVDNLSRAHIKAHILHQHSFAFPPNGDYADRVRRPPGNNPRVPLPLATPNIPGAEDEQGQVWPKTLSDRLHGYTASDLPEVGDYVLVNWSEDQKYYGGHVTKLDRMSSRAGVLYDDGEYEELNLSKEGFKFPTRTGAQPLKWRPSAITPDDMINASGTESNKHNDINNKNKNDNDNKNKSKNRKGGAGGSMTNGTKRSKNHKGSSSSSSPSAVQVNTSPRLQHLRSRKRVCYRDMSTGASSSH